jgi:hypothetical protein
MAVRRPDNDHGIVAFSMNKAVSVGCDPTRIDIPGMRSDKPDNSICRGISIRLQKVSVQLAGQGLWSVVIPTPRAYRLTDTLSQTRKRNQDPNYHNGYYSGLHIPYLIVKFFRILLYQELP